MYVNPFWMGVLATLMVETLFTIGFIMRSILKQNKKRDDE